MLFFILTTFILHASIIIAKPIDESCQWDTPRGKIETIIADGRETFFSRLPAPNNFPVHPCQTRKNQLDITKKPVSFTELSPRFVMPAGVFEVGFGP